MDLMLEKGCSKDPSKTIINSEVEDIEILIDSEDQNSNSVNNNFDFYSHSDNYINLL